MSQCLIFTFEYSCGCSVLDMPELGEMIERIDYRVFVSLFLCVCVCVCMCVCERERERERDRERDRDRDRDRDRERQTDRQTDRETERQGRTDRQTETETDRQRRFSCCQHSSSTAKPTVADGGQASTALNEPTAKGALISASAVPPSLNLIHQTLSLRVICPSLPRPCVALGKQRLITPRNRAKTE